MTTATETTQEQTAQQAVTRFNLLAELANVDLSKERKDYGPLKAGEVILGPMDDTLRRLACLKRDIREKALPFLVEIDQRMKEHALAHLTFRAEEHDCAKHHEKVAEIMAKSGGLITQAEEANNLFFTLARMQFPEIGEDGIGIREDCQIVRLPKQEEEDDTPEMMLGDIGVMLGMVAGRPTGRSKRES